MPQTVADTPLSTIWDSHKNASPASSVPALHYRPAWWLCPKGHSFSKPPRMMLANSECPHCKVSQLSTSLADKFPKLIPLWHTEKNGALSASNIDAASTAECWWRCTAGHDFQRAPLIMARSADCPICALAASSLAALFPAVAAEWHAEKNGSVSAKSISADHLMVAWWTCPQGHVYQATVRARGPGGKRCPHCYGGWSIEVIRDFVKSLLPHVQALNPSEKFALAMQAGLLREKESRPFVKAFTSGRFPVDELEKFVRGDPSAVDGFAVPEPFSLTIQQAPEQKPAAPADPYALPAAPEPEDKADIDVSQTVAVTHAGIEAAASIVAADDSNDLPLVQSVEALSALDNVLIASADAETVKFLLDSAKAKLWRHAYTDPKGARAQAASFEGGVYASLAKDRFLTELDEAESLTLPPGYSFRPFAGAPITPPNLMQRRVAVCVRQARRFGNWSGMGAGKTLSAILATRVVDAKMTIICCPNAVVRTWAEEIRKAFADCEVAEKTWKPEWKDPLQSRPRYLVMNYEQFQQPDSEANLVAFLDEHIIDFVVVDEIHYAKQRDAAAEMSRRKRLVQALILEAAKKNTDLCVLGMSGTPVINTLQEGKSLIELITGHRHDDLDTNATVQNCMRLYQRLVTLGTRWKPDYPVQLEVERLEVDCTSDLEDIREVAQGTILELEQVLTRLRIPTIIASIKPGEKALIYTHYVDGIVKQLVDALKDAGLKVGVLTGDTDSADLDEFKKPQGRVDVLVASSRIATGVDGLQHVCRKLIINVLPWTNAEYEQLVGRLYRQGSKFEKVHVLIPVTFASVKGERWSYCESKLDRIEYKKSIGDAAVDGIVPEGNLRTPAQAQQDIMNWLRRLQDGDLETFQRRQIVIPLSGEPSEVSRRLAAYGDFSRLNNRWYQSGSHHTHARLVATPEEWAHYHTMYRELRKSWPIVPFEEELRWLQQRDGLIVGDFGCGEALIAEKMKEKHVVHSFDHVAINGNVVACDMKNVPLENGTLDLAVFCLSLMGSNFAEYLREAWRVLRLDGDLHIWEPLTHFTDVKGFCEDLERFGFDVYEPRVEGAFVRIYASRNTSIPSPNITVRFRTS